MANENLFQALISLKETKGRFSTGSVLYFYIQSHPDFRQELFELSKFFLEQRLGSCDSCYVDAYIRLLQLDNDFAKKKAECQYRLNEGQLIYLDSKPITNYNLTNELAARYLELHPEEKQRFSILPSKGEIKTSEAVLEVIKENTSIEQKKKAGRPKKK